MAMGIREIEKSKSSVILPDSPDLTASSSSLAQPHVVTSSSSIQSIIPTCSTESTTFSDPPSIKTMTSKYTPYKTVRLSAEMKVVYFPIGAKTLFKFKFVIILFID